MRRFALPALLAVALLITVGCQDHRWAENETPVCNQTAEPEVQEIAGKLDILFVIDNSGTMLEEQLNVAENFDAFIAKLVGLDEENPDSVGTDVDYQIGVATTDVEAGGCLLRAGDGNPRHRIINDETDRDYWTEERILQAFAENIKTGVGGSFEQGLEAMRCSLEHPDNTGFLRPDSKLAIVFVTDENDCSGLSCPPSEPDCLSQLHPLWGCDDRAADLTPVTEYFDWLVDEDGAASDDRGKRQPKKVIVAGIVGVRDDTAQAIPLPLADGPRDYEVACWPFVPETSGAGGTLTVEGVPQTVTLAVPRAQHSFTTADVGKLAQVPYSAASADRGNWEILALAPATENAVRLKVEAVIEPQSDVAWALGASDGLATEGSRYIDLITRVCKASGKCKRDSEIPLFASTICTENWSETLERIGALISLRTVFCLDALPAGIDDLGSGDCETIEPWVQVELHDPTNGQWAPLSCGKGEHQWTLAASDDPACVSGWEIQFPDSTHDAPFPEPGRGLRIQYLAEQGNSERCLMSQTAE